MATMEDEIAVASKAPDQHGAARPDWQRQPHTWFLAGLVLANIAFDGLAVAEAKKAMTLSAEAIIVGVLLAQLFLMGLWMALGGLCVAGRFSAVAAATMAGAAANWFGGLFDGSEFQELAALSGAIVLATHAVLLPLRALLGYRIDFDPAYHARSPDKSMQLRLQHLIAFTAACALPFALVRAIGDGQSALLAFSCGGIGLVASFPIAWILVAARRTLRFWLTALGMLLVSLVVDLRALGTLFPRTADALLVYFTIAATVLANLGVLRLVFGLRLFSILGTAPDAGAASRRAPLDANLTYHLDA